MGKTYPNMPRDGANSIPVTGLGTAQILDPDQTTHAVNATAFTGAVLTVVGDASFYWALGGASVEATSGSPNWWPASAPLDMDCGSATHISVLRADGTGTMICRVYERE